MTAPGRFSVDYLDILLDLLRADLGAGVHVMSRIPDHLPDYLPLVVIRRVGGDSDWPELYDRPWINVQCWCDDPRTPESDQYRAASDLADAVRRSLWTAWRTQRVINGRGWIGFIRESQGPQEVSDPDRILLGRYAATYELRIRSAA